MIWLVKVAFVTLALNRFEFLQTSILTGTGSFLLTSREVPPSTTLHDSSLPQARPALDPECLSSTTRHFKRQIQQAAQEDPSLAGPLIRLAFHDAATYEYGPRYLGGSASQVSTGGPNGSIRYELGRYENRALSRPLQVAEALLRETTTANDSGGGGGGGTCAPLSVADAIALAGVAAVQAAGGPEIPIRLGRPDADTSDAQFLRRPLKKDSKRSEVNTTLPSAGLDSVGLRLYFGRLGLSEPELVALSGVHGLGRHVSLLNMTKACLKNLTQTCLETAPVSLPFVTASVDRFDNTYFQTLLRWNHRQVSMGEVAFIPTDVALVVDDGLRRHVQAFANDEQLYFRVFRRAFQKLVDTTATTKEVD
jgi:L-ascorbate peroxidase